jgi:predicted phosphodiesterase
MNYNDPPRVITGPGSPAQPLRRFALIGDVHAEDERLQTALAYARQANVEHILCVGDVADGYGDLDQTMRLLALAKVLVVRGNHERWFLADELRTLRLVQFQDEHPEAAEAMRFWLPCIEVATVQGALLLCHAVGHDDFSVVKPHHTDSEVRAITAWQAMVESGRYRFMAAGHTHEVMVRALDGITILNAGTLKRDDSPGFAILDLEAMTMQLFDLEDPQHAIPSSTFPIP